MEGLGQLQQLLTSGRLTADRGEALDLQGGAGLGDSLDPLVLLALGGGLLGHDLAVLVLDQVVLLQATDGLHLAAFEHGAVGTGTGLVA